MYHIKTFVEIAETGILTEAAARLNTSQPAVSAQLKALEEEVGFALFYRSAKGMSITEKGSELLVEAKHILASVEEFHRKALALKGGPADTVRIGLNTEGKTLRIDRFIKSASVSLPQVELHFLNTKSEDFVADLSGGKICAGFFYGQVQHPSVHAIKLHSYRMTVVYPNSWGAPAEGLSLAFFAEKPWIWTTRGCPFYKQSIDYFHSRGLVPQKIMYVDDESLIGELVQNEVGCSLLAEPIALGFAEKNRLRVWRELDFYVDLHFGYPKEKRGDALLGGIETLVKQIWKV